MWLDIAKTHAPWQRLGPSSVWSKVFDKPKRRGDALAIAASDNQFAN
jgi:hypothetical protein